MLQGLGRREGALVAISEAVAINRALANARLKVFGPALARSLDSHAMILDQLGRNREAEESRAEATSIRRAI